VLDESVGYTVGHGLFFVDGKEIGKVPRLAICKDKASELFTLYYCDKDWSPLGVATNYQSVDAEKHRAIPAHRLVGSTLVQMSGKTRLPGVRETMRNFHLWQAHY
jgi:hypothetical protein